MSQRYRKMGEILRDKGLLSEARLQNALDMQSGTQMRFGEVLLALGYVSEQQIARCLAEQYEMQMVDLKAVHPAREALDLLTPMRAVSHRVLPVTFDGQKLTCVISDPIDLPLLDELRLNLNAELETWLAPPIALGLKIAKAYGLSVRDLRSKGILPPAPKVRRKVRPQRDRAALLTALAPDEALEAKA